MRKALVESGLLDRSRKIRSDETHVYLPVLDMDAARSNNLEQIAAFEPVQIDFPPEERPATPEDILGYRPALRWWETSPWWRRLMPRPWPPP